MVGAWLAPSARDTPDERGAPVVTAGAAEPCEDADTMTSVSPCLPFRRVHVTSVCLHRLLWSQHMTWGTAGIYWVYIYMLQGQMNGGSGNRNWGVSYS